MALAAIQGERTLAEQFDVHPNQITQRRTQLLEGASGVFGAAAAVDPAPVVDVKTLHAKIGELTVENDFCPARDALRGERHWFERAAQGSAAERRTMIDHDHGLSISRQAKALGISRGSVYYPQQNCSRLL